MEHVIADYSAFAWAKRVNSSHVAKDTPTEVMDMVKADCVAFCQAVGVTPLPAGRDSCVEEIANIIMCDNVVTTVSDPDAHCVHVGAAAGSDNTVVNCNVVGAGRLVWTNPALSDTHAASAEVI